MGPKCSAGLGHVEGGCSAASATFSSTVMGADVGAATSRLGNFPEGIKRFVEGTGSSYWPHSRTFHLALCLPYFLGDLDAPALALPRRPSLPTPMAPKKVKGKAIVPQE